MAFRPCFSNVMLEGDRGVGVPTNELARVVIWPAARVRRERVWYEPALL